MAFFSTICAKFVCQVADFLGASEQCRGALTKLFHAFPLQISNAIPHESCVLRKTTQLSYWENLKCLGKIWRMRQKFRLTLVGQKGFKGFDLGFDPTLTMS
jgi:hypothetical protein